MRQTIILRQKQGKSRKNSEKNQNFIGSLENERVTRKDSKSKKAQNDFFRKTENSQKDRETTSLKQKRPKSGMNIRQLRTKISETNLRNRKQMSIVQTYSYSRILSCSFQISHFLFYFKSLEIDHLKRANWLNVDRDKFFFS